ncbi:MAG: S8 family serine peptidase [Planctomycetes bacterium]|nr:S8 family serine peptidase [Planctomycetota bacterium]
MKPGVLALASLLVLPLGASGQEEWAYYLVLGKSQLLADGGAFAEFQKENGGLPAAELRKKTIARLKAIAAQEQPGLLAALGSPRDVRPLWIVNAVVVPLSQTKARAAQALECVRWVYPAEYFPWEEGGAGKVAEVLSRTKREPFAIGRKRIPWNLKELNVPAVWKSLKVTGEGVVVTSFDEGLNYRHRDLRKNMWLNSDEIPNNGKDDDQNGLVDDLYGFDFTRMKAEVLDAGPDQHGTLTSCLIVGDGTGGQVTGVAPRAELMAVRAEGGAYLAARAFQYALEEGARVVNMSFSIPDLGETRGLWRMMAEHATCAGMVLVSGAGNFRQDADVPEQIRIPEGIPCVICVGGVDEHRRLAPFSSTGPVEWKSVKLYQDFPLPRGLVKPDVVAFPGPRLGLVGTDDDASYLDDGNLRQGNSLSGPQVAGVCALMLSANPDLPPWRVKELLESTARDLVPRGKDNETGAGLVNAFKAVQAAIRERKRR